MESNRFFATEKPSRLFFRVALPGMVSMLAMSIYNVIEGAFIGKMLGETAFAAINIGMPLTMINFSLADMMGVGSSVPISIALGRKDHDRANNYFSCALLLIVAAAALMGVVMYTGVPLFVRLMGAEGELAELSIRYTRVFALMGVVTTTVFAMDNYLRICGYVRGSMILNIVMSALTIGFLWLFVAVGRMNVEGSALAICCAMFLCAIAALTPFVQGKTLLKFVRPQLSVRMLREVVACGSPTFINNMAGRLASIVMNVMLLRVGGATAVAAYSVLMYANEIIQPMLYGMNDSLQPAIGYNWGAGMHGRVKEIAKCSFAGCAVVSLLGAAVMFAFPGQVAGLFIAAGDTALLEMTTHAMRLFCLAYLFRWFGFAAQGFFSAIEKPLAASILSLSSAMLFPVGLVWLLGPMGLDGLWLNLAGTSLCVAVMAFCMLRRFQKGLRTD